MRCSAGLALLYGLRCEINVNNQLRGNIVSLLNLSLIGSNNKFSHLSGVAEEIRRTCSGVYNIMDAKGS